MLLLLRSASRRASSTGVDEGSTRPLPIGTALDPRVVGLALEVQAPPPGKIAEAVLVVRSEAAKQIVTKLNDYELVPSPFTGPIGLLAGAFNLRRRQATQGPGLAGYSASAYLAAVAAAGLDVMVNARLTGLVDDSFVYDLRATDPTAAPTSALLADIVIPNTLLDAPTVLNAFDANVGVDAASRALLIHGDKGKPASLPAPPGG